MSAGFNVHMQSFGAIFGYLFLLTSPELHPPLLSYLSTITMTGEEIATATGNCGNQPTHEGTSPGSSLSVITNMKTSLTLAHKNHDDLSLEVKHLASALQETNREVASLKDTSAKLLSYTKDLEDSILVVDSSSRKKNLFI